MKSSKYASLLAAAAILGTGSMPVPTQASSSLEARTSTSSKSQNQTGNTLGLRTMAQAMRTIHGGGGKGSYRAGYPKPGHSVRQGQRMARKASNRARNRRAHR